jgi:hypothetical protein
MEHIDQHILELFVLGSEKVQSRRAEIESHLEECYGCRSLVEQMEGSYRSVEARFRDLQQRPLAMGEAIERNRPKPAPRYEDAAAPARNYRPVTRFQRVQYLVRRHPVIVGSGAFAVLAVLGLLLNPVKQSSAPTDRNPASTHINPAERTLEVLNRRHEVILRLPLADSEDALSAASEERGGHTLLADLDDDGVSELITTLRLSDHTGADNVILQAYRGSGEEYFHSARWAESISYRGSPYQLSFHAGTLLVGKFGNTGGPQILLQMDNGRSPNAILRISARGDVLGSYWHHGQLMGLYQMDLDRSGCTEIVATGRNDADGDIGGSFAAVVVLDPNLIVGKTESLASPGYGVAPARCELYYVRFPFSDMNELVPKTFGDIRNMVFNPSLDSLHMRFVFASATPTGNPMFEYLLTRKMEAAIVKSTDNTDNYHSSLVAQGKLKGSIDQEYLENLKKGVRYFNGRKWVAEAVRVRQPTVP